MADYLQLKSSVEDLWDNGATDDQLRSAFMQKGYDWDSFQKQYFQEQRAGQEAEMLAGGAVRDVEVPGFFESLDQGYQELSKPNPMLLGLPNVAGSLAAGAANIPQAFADIPSSLMGLMEQDISGKLGMQLEDVENLPSEMYEGEVPLTTRFSRRLEEATLSNMDEVYQNLHKPIKFAGEFIDVLVPVGALSKGAKALKAVSTIGSDLEKATSLGIKAFGDEVARLSARSLTPSGMDAAKMVAFEKITTPERAADYLENVVSAAKGALDPDVSRLIRPDTLGEYAARSEVDFMRNVQRGLIPPSKENVLRSIEIAERIDNVPGAKAAIDPYLNIKVAENSAEDAARNIAKERAAIFQTGKEELGPGEGFLSSTGKLYKHLVDKDHALKQLGRMGDDKTVYGAARALRDIGGRQDVPIFQGTYRLSKGADDIPLDPISNALNKNILARGYADPEEVVFTGEGLSHIIRGQWEQLPDGTAKFIDDPMSPEMFDDFGLYTFARRMVTDVRDRKVNELVLKNYLGLLKGWEREARALGKESPEVSAQLGKLQQVQGEVQKNLEFFRLPLTAENVRKFTQITKDMEVKWGTDFAKIQDRATRLTQFEARNVLDRAEEVGLLSKAMKAKILQNNEHHVPIRFLMNAMGDPYRIVEKVKKPPKTKIKGKPGKQIQKGKEALGLQRLQTGFGENYRYVDPIEEVIRRNNSSVAFYERQRVANKVVELQKEILGLGKATPPIAGADPSMSALAHYLDNMQDFHLEKVNSLPGGMQPENTIRIFNNGKVEYWKADPELVKAVSGLSPQEFGITMKVLAGAAHMLRIGATSTPRFAIRNFLRDPLTQLLFTEEGGVPFFDSLMGLAHYFRRDDIYQEFIRSGMGHATQTTMEADFAFLKGMWYEELLKGGRSAPTAALRMLHQGKPGRAALQGGYQAMRAFGQATEQAGRIGHFARLKKIRAGKSPIIKLLNDYTVGIDKSVKALVDGKGLKGARDAFRAYKKRDIQYLDMLEAVREGTLDFHRVGETARYLNRVRAFTNANFQDFDKLIRSFQERPFTTSVRAFTALGLPSLYFYNKNKGNPDFHEEASYKRDLFWYVHQLEDGSWLRVPKPFLPGVIFGSLFERFAEYIDKEDPENFEAMMNDIIHGNARPLMQAGKMALEMAPTELLGGAELANLPPGGQPYDPMSMGQGLPDLAGTVMQSAANYDVFRQRDIVPEYLGGGAPGYKYSESTSPTTVAAGQAMPSVVNPVYAQWLAGELLGGSGRLALDVADMATKATGGEIPKGKTLSEASQVLGISERRSIGFGSESVRRFYEIRNRLNYLKDTHSNLKEKMPKEASEFYKKNSKDLAMQGMFASISRSLAELARARTKISASDIEDEAKEKRLKKLDEMITKLAQKAVGRYK